MPHRGVGPGASLGCSGPPVGSSPWHRPLHRQGPVPRDVLMVKCPKGVGPTMTPGGLFCRMFFGGEGVWGGGGERWSSRPRRFREHLRGTWGVGGGGGSPHPLLRVVPGIWLTPRKQKSIVGRDLPSVKALGKLLRLCQRHGRHIPPTTFMRGGGMDRQPPAKDRRRADVQC